MIVKEKNLYEKVYLYKSNKKKKKDNNVYLKSRFFLIKNIVIKTTAEDSCRQKII